jgi:hypothetical protein
VLESDGAEIDRMARRLEEALDRSEVASETLRTQARTRLTASLARV